MSFPIVPAWLWGHLSYNHAISYICWQGHWPPANQNYKSWPCPKG